LRRVAAAVAAACAVAFGSGNASAFEFDIGNPDLTIRWDNTVRYNYGVRVENRDNKIGNTVIADEGTWRFDRGDAVANRFDVLTEVDVVYMKRFGARLSAAGWYDFAYNDDSKTNPNLPFSQIPSYINKKYSTYTDRFYQGPSGEILDAFVFAGFDLGRRRRRSRSVAILSTGANRCSSTATCTASPTRRTRSICRRDLRRPVPRPRNCSVR
jgi:hypothetical protein